MSKEMWRDVVGFKGLYQVSNLGNVRSLDRKVKHILYGETKLEGGLRKLGKTLKGYRNVQLSKNNKLINKRVHRLVAEAFIPNIENKPMVCHKNDIRHDNRVENLFWGTAKDNRDDCIEKGRRGRHKLEKSIICLETGELFKSQSEASRKLNIAQSSIGKVANGLLKKVKGLTFRYEDHI